jgi:hypothetical protein
MGRIYISFDEPLIVTCPCCGGGRGDFVNPCDWCGATGGVPPEAARDQLATLVHNLAIAGTLCRAFHLGRAWQYERLASEWNGGGWTYPFEPGCGRSAP